MIGNLVILCNIINSFNNKIYRSSIDVRDD